MGSETKHKIPTVDFTKENLNPGTEEWVSACREIRHGFEEYSCFEVVSGKIPIELLTAVFTATEDLFHLPLETKMQKTSERPYHSYVGQSSLVPLYESLAIDNPTTLEGSQNFTNLMWPTGNEGFRESAHSIAKKLAEILEMATRMVFDTLGVAKHYESNIAQTSYLLRFQKYRTLREDEDKTSTGLISHFDRTFLTILHQYQVDGLQVKSKDGLWIDVETTPSTFLVIAGDIIGAWSNDRVRPCEHRVIIKENKTRYSIGFFGFINGVIDVPEELIDEENPLRYKPIDHFGWLSFQAQGRPAYSIKDYSGI